MGINDYPYDGGDLNGCVNDARIGGVYHGAMTYYAPKAIQEANYQITFQQLHTRLLHLLDDAGYPQHPQLEGRKTNKKKQVFE